MAKHTPSASAQTTQALTAADIEGKAYVFLIAAAMDSDDWDAVLWYLEQLDAWRSEYELGPLRIEGGYVPRSSWVKGGRS